MGIQGLIPFLDKVSSRTHVSEFKGSCVAVDAYCWLHKGAYTCAEKLAKGEKCDAYVFYCMKYVNMLLSHNIKPILVFDGRHLPAKAGTEKKRRESRAVNRKTATELLNAGRVDEARNYLRRCVDVTHAMALALIQECRKINVDCIVAPYEADAQLAYLNLQNIAQIVITEDSDLILFGCSKIMFKLDLQGHGLLVEHERLYLSMGVRAENFSFDSFRYMCILSGCDYLPSLPGIGLNKALKFINKTRDPDIHRALRRMPAYLNMTQLRVSDEYRDTFLLADATFRYQPVFDPMRRAVVPLTEPPEGEDPPAIVDEKLPPDVAFNLALGNLDPFTLEQVDNFHPDSPSQCVANLKRRSWAPVTVADHPSIWSRDFRGCTSSTPKEERFPGMLNRSAVLDVTPLRAPHHSPKALEVAQVEDSVLPSQADLQSMYSNSGLPMPGRKEKATDMSLAVPPTPCSPERDSTSVSTPCGEHTSEFQPLSPILSQRKSRNPFAKPKQASSAGLGPPGGLGRPNYFSALRKFDGIYPMDIDSDVVVVSRYFRFMGPGDKKQAENADKESEDVLKDVSNTSHQLLNETAQIDEEDVLAGYSNEKENEPEAGGSPQRGSLLATIEVMQSKRPSVAQPESLCNTERGGEEKPEVNRNVENMEVEFTNVETIVRQPEDQSARNSAPSFNWSQFTSKKSLFSAKLASSQAANRTFKNPFRKTCISKFSSSVRKDILEVGGAGENPSWLTSTPQQSIEEESAGVPKQPSSESDPSEPNLSKEVEPEQVSQTSCDEGSSADASLGACDDGRRSAPSAAAMEDDLRPSEDNLQRLDAEAEELPLSSGSTDSGFQDSQDPSFKTCWQSSEKLQNHYAARPSAQKQGTPSGRRLGLGRSSTPSQAPQKQNLLAQYGFSKKRKLAH